MYINVLILDTSGLTSFTFGYFGYTWILASLHKQCLLRVSNILKVYCCPLTECLLVIWMLQLEWWFTFSNLFFFSFPFSFVFLMKWLLIWFKITSYTFFLPWTIFQQKVKNLELLALIYRKNLKLMFLSISFFIF